MIPTSLFVLAPMKPILVYPSIVGDNVASVSYCSAELAPTSKFVSDVTGFIIIAFLLFSVRLVFGALDRSIRGEE